MSQYYVKSAIWQQRLIEATNMDAVISQMKREHPSEEIFHIKLIEPETET